MHATNRNQAKTRILTDTILRSASQERPLLPSMTLSRGGLVCCLQRTDNSSQCPMTLNVQPPQDWESSGLEEHVPKACGSIPVAQEREENTHYL